MGLYLDLWKVDTQWRILQEPAGRLGNQLLDVAGLVAVMVRHRNQLLEGRLLMYYLSHSSNTLFV